MFNWFSKDKSKAEPVQTEENELKDLEFQKEEQSDEQQDTIQSVTKETQSEEQPSVYDTLQTEVERLRTELYELKKTVESKPDVILYYDGSLYVGQIKDSVPDGFGTICYSSGERYYGEWKNGLYNGTGAYYKDYYSYPFYSEWINHSPK